MELLVSSSNKIAIIMTINKTGRLGRKRSHECTSDKKNHRETLPEPQLCTRPLQPDTANNSATVQHLLVRPGPGVILSVNP